MWPAEETYADRVHARGVGGNGEFESPQHESGPRARPEDHADDRAAASTSRTRSCPGPIPAPQSTTSGADNETLVTSRAARPQTSRREDGVAASGTRARAPSIRRRHGRHALARRARRRQGRRASSVAEASRAQGPKRTPLYHGPVDSTIGPTCVQRLRPTARCSLLAWPRSRAPRNLPGATETREPCASFEPLRRVLATSPAHALLADAYIFGTRVGPRDPTRSRAATIPIVDEPRQNAEPPSTSNRLHGGDRSRRVIRRSSPLHHARLVRLRRDA